MNSLKIEKGAVKTLKDIIYFHDMMDEYINENDKEPCWDGSIIIYSDSDMKAEHILYRVPVQIKGKNDEKLLNRSRITYPVEYKNLRNYYKDGGVCYFVIVISDDGKKTRVFYNMMTPIKIQSYLKGTEKKKPEQTKSIPLIRLKNNDGDELYRALMQFGHDSKEQGTGELVRKSISLEDMEKIDSIRMTAFSKDSESARKGISSGEVCVFGHISGSDIWKPFSYDLQRELELVECRRMNETFGIDGVPYYEQFEIRKKEDNGFCIQLSKNLVIEFSKKKILFNPKTKLEEAARDVKFLEAMKYGKSLYIGNDKFGDYDNANYDGELQRVMREITLMQSATTEYGITINKRIEDFAKDDWKAMDELVKIYERKIVPKKETAWHMWWWDEKVVPFFIAKDSEGEIHAENGVHFKLFSITINGTEREYKVSPILMFKRDVWEKLYDVEENILLEEIEKSEFNKETEDRCSLLLLEILAAYDMTRNEKYYNVAKVISDKLLEISPDNAYWKINMFQILKRKRELLEEELLELEEIEQNTEDKKLICAINILLDNKRKAKKELDNMSTEDKKVFTDYPIYNLL